ncbi:hypothetical protein Msil_2462 [Methylocella silvestris BL2]|uniref:Apple domain-containing protein n=1 Tax=Methylocella silvestris (strain DSM 15510 / CIP 108128 / LMG 27833 / NCIMB 13906 / BL2) TaxID=395965 RepID=B8EKM1_METSB|nr:hypothetical protein [Methylocella silvestris]ACK51391.1 hypothetical protein Msil_2462 [Methylocella silvestris BL2]
MLRRLSLSLLFVASAISLAARAEDVNAPIVFVQFMGTPGEPDAVPMPPGEDDPQDWEEEAEASAPSRTCVKMCAADDSPCDPIYFKTEDGRCDGVHIR